MELYACCRSKKDLKHIESLLFRYDIHYIDKVISKNAYDWMKQFRSSHGVEINDMLIAATAFSLEAKLISKNQKHYQFLPDLNLLEYPFTGVLINTRFNQSAALAFIQLSANLKSTNSFRFRSAAAG